MAKINLKAARRRAMAYGVVVFLVFAAVLWTAISAGGGLPGGDEQRVRAAFDEVGSLIVGDDVRIGNVRAGRVSDIELKGNQPVVTLTFDEHREIYRNAAAGISARSSLGQKYVEIDPGDPSSGELGPGQVIAATKTKNANDIAELLDTFDKPTRQALRSTLREVGGGAIGRHHDFAAGAKALPAILGDLGAVSRALSADGGAGVESLLNATDDLARSFHQHEQDLTHLSQNLATTMRSINADDGDALEAVLDRAPATMRDTRAALSGLAGPLAETKHAMSGLRPGAEALGAATPNLRGVFREAQEPLGKVPAVAEQAEPTVDGLTSVLRDARPLAPQVAKAVSRARQPVEYMSPYAPEVALFFKYLRAALSYGSEELGGNWLRVVPIFRPENASGAIPVADPTVNRNAYPDPGEAARDRTNHIPGERK